MEVQRLLAELRKLVESAKGRPMSGSVVVNRGQILDVVGRLEKALSAPAADGKALSEGGQSADGEGADADRRVAQAEQERDRPVGETEVFRVARIEADKERHDARREAEQLRQETDDYIDRRLATFEIALTRTLEAVARGRERLQSRSHFDALTDDALADDARTAEARAAHAASDDAAAGDTTEQRVDRET